MLFTFADLVNHLSLAIVNYNLMISEANLHIPVREDMRVIKLLPGLANCFKPFL